MAQPMASTSMAQPMAHTSIGQPSTSALTYADHQARALARRRYCFPLSNCNVGHTVFYQILDPHSGTGHLVPATIQTKNQDGSVTVNIHPNRDNNGQSIITVPKHDIPKSLITGREAKKRDYRGGGGSRRRHRNKNKSRRRCQSRRRNRRRR